MLRFGLVPVVIILLISGVVGGFCWPYALNEWLVFLGKEPSVTFWQGVVLGVIPYLGQASIVIAVVTWILMLFIGG